MKGTKEFLRKKLLRTERQKKLCARCLRLVRFVRSEAAFSGWSKDQLTGQWRYCPFCTRKRSPNTEHAS